MVRIPSEYQEVEYLERKKEGAIIIIPYDTIPMVDCDVFIGASVLSSSGERAYAGNCQKGGNWEVYFPSKVWKSTTASIVVVESTILKVGKPGETHLRIDGSVGLTLGHYRYGNFQSDCRIYYARAEDSDGLFLNLIPCYRKSDNEPGMYDTVSKTFFTNSGTGTFLVGNDVNYSNTNLLETRRQILLNTPHIESMAGNPLTFKTDMERDLKECKIRFLPVQAGEGTPSPENVRPISGWDGVSVTRCGKNLFDGINVSIVDRKRKNDSGDVVNDNTASYTENYIPVFPNTKYVVSGFSSIRGKRFYFYDKEKNFIKRTTVNVLSITTPSNCYFIQLQGGELATEKYSNVQLELGTEATPYEPYTGYSISIPFPQTIFGGYVDLIKGEIVEEIDSDGEEITPNVYSLTPQTIKALKGLNNLYSDANGNVEVKFWKH